MPSIAPTPQTIEMEKKTTAEDPGLNASLGSREALGATPDSLSYDAEKGVSAQNAEKTETESSEEVDPDLVSCQR